MMEYSMNTTEDTTANISVFVKCLYKDSFTRFLKSNNDLALGIHRELLLTLNKVIFKFKRKILNLDWDLNLGPPDL